MQQAVSIFAFDCVRDIHYEPPELLVCYKNGNKQQGHLGRERARWVAIWRRRLAMECGLCRSVLIGSAAGLRFARQTG